MDAKNLTQNESSESAYQALMLKISNGETLKTNELKMLTDMSSDMNEGDVSFPDILTNQNQTAIYAGVSRVTVKYHVDRGNLTPDKNGHFKRVDVDKWMSERKIKKSDKRRLSPEQIAAMAEEENIDFQMKVASLRYRLAKAEKEEHAAALLKGQAYYQEDVLRDWSKRVQLVVSGLEAFSDRLPPLLEGKSKAEMQQLLKDEIRYLREQYAKKGRYTPPPEKSKPGKNNKKGNKKCR